MAKTTSPSAAEIAPALLVQLEAARKLVELARDGLLCKANELGLQDSNKIERAVADIAAAETGLRSACDAMRRHVAPTSDVATLLYRCGFTVASNAV